MLSKNNSVHAVAARRKEMKHFSSTYIYLRQEFLYRYDCYISLFFPNAGNLNAAFFCKIEKSFSFVFYGQFVLHRNGDYIYGRYSSSINNFNGLSSTCVCAKDDGRTVISNSFSPFSFNPFRLQRDAHKSKHKQIRPSKRSPHWRS